MKVREVIERLQTMPQDAEVFIFDDYSRDAMNPLGVVDLREEGPFASGLRITPYVWMGLGDRPPS